MSFSRQPSQFAPRVLPRIVLHRTAPLGIALGALLGSLCLAQPSGAQGMGGTGGGGGSGTGGSGTGGSGTGGSGTGGSGTGGSSMTGSGGSPDDPGAVCTFEEPKDCPDRCPMFASCFVSGTRGQESHLYYRVQEQRFECEGLNCTEAVKQLGDYCCQRGEFAPDDDGGGGCMLPGGVAAASSSSEGPGPWLGVGLGLCATAVGLSRRRRAHR